MARAKINFPKDNDSGLNFDDQLRPAADWNAWSARATQGEW
jgi:hypothetical protein